MEGLFGQPPPESPPPESPPPEVGSAKRKRAVALGPPRDDVVQVAVERGLDHVDGLTYLDPPGRELAVGDRVQVPLGRKDKPTRGVVVARGSEGPTPLRLKAVLRVEPGPALPKELVELGRWIARYYACPLGVALSSMLPAAVKHGTGSTVKRYVRTPPPETPEVELQGDGKQPRLSKQQRALIDALPAEGAWVALDVLMGAAGVKTTGPAQKLIDAGLLEAEDRPTVRSRLITEAQTQCSKRSPIPDDRLTPGQADAITRLKQASSQGFGVHLLHGVTGSGKTEVYLRLIEHVLGATPSRELLTSNGGARDRLASASEATSGVASGGGSVIVLVPEIALTPQTVARFVGRFERVAVLHSGLTAAQRHAEWRRIHAGEVEIIIGARSAVFAPAPNLQLIVVDEEHDGSYKQDQSPRYHGRDVAIRRAHQLGVPVVLGSATPSLESWSRAKANASADPGALLSLPDRPSGWKLPKVEVVDLVQERRERKGVHLLSRRLEQHLRRTLDAGRQAVLLLNRRGYASYLACTSHACGWQMRCHHCDAAMVFHRDKRMPTGGLTKCHHCGAQQVVPTQCPSCGRRLLMLGEGVQRVEQELANKMPDATWLRMDADTMRRSEDYRKALDSFGKGEADILLGTQMIAKGLDFPGVSLVGVISADTSLQIPDFRAAERTFHLIAQVVGRAGRGETPGVAVVQTAHPDDPSVKSAAAQDYVRFAERELASRKHAGLPPTGRLARVVCRDTDMEKARARARAIAEACSAAAQSLGVEVEAAGPAPCAVARVADHFRFEVRLLAKGDNASGGSGGSAGAAQLQAVLARVRGVKLPGGGGLVSGEGVAIDVDPVTLL